MIKRDNNVRILTLFEQIRDFHSSINAAKTMTNFESVTEMVFTVFGLIGN